MKLLIRILKHYAAMLPLIVGFYGVRLLWWDYSYGEFRIRPPLIAVQMLINLVVLGLIGLVICAILALVILISLRLSKSSFPSGFLLMGIFLMILIPLPETPPLPETAHFLKYRADYEHVVELARQGTLLNSSEDYCKHAPLAYQHVSEAGCIVIQSQNDGLVVEFNSIESSYHPVVYIEFDDTNYPCPYDLNLEERLDEHWVVCWRDWN